MQAECGVKSSGELYLFWTTLLSGQVEYGWRNIEMQLVQCNYKDTYFAHMSIVQQI